ncbi:hypothetical protein DFH29DRAFT_873978 [Suillus ampliporus]|nr:hypothetical protein DFH29DRAFT_873978 [Suillus ampliporus]
MVTTCLLKSVQAAANAMVALSIGVGIVLAQLSIARTAQFQGTKKVCYTEFRLLLTSVPVKLLSLLPLSFSIPAGSRQQLRQLLFALAFAHVVVLSYYECMSYHPTTLQKQLVLLFNQNIPNLPTNIIIMACPPIYKTDEAKLEAARERRRCHYANNSKKQRQYIEKAPSWEILEIQKALAEAFGYEDDATTSEMEADDDENDKLFDLPECLLALKSIKDEMLALVPEPCTFTEGVLHQYLKSFLDDGNGKGDISIVDTAKTKVEGLLRHVTPVQDQIMNLCGVSEESHAAELVSRFLSTVLAYLDDVQYFLNIEGFPELTLAHSMGELMYQKGHTCNAKYYLSMFETECSVLAGSSLLQWEWFMAGTEWVMAEQKAFLQGLYSDFLKAQLQATLTAFWTEVYCTWFEKWPEISIMYPSVPDHESLTEEQNKLLGIAVKTRHQQIRTWFNYQSQRGGHASVNAMMKSIQKMLGNKAKGTQVHTPAEIFTKSSHGADVHNKLITTKGEKLNTARKLAQEAYAAASPNVQVSCIATVQAECDAKASEVLKQKHAAEERTNTELAKALEECPGPIAHFLQAIHEMTGFHWSIMGTGPDPRYNGDINVISYHTGVNEQGHVRKMCALSYVPSTPSQKDTSTSGSLSIENGALPPASAPITSLLLSFDTHDFASSCGSSDYMELPTFSSSYRSSDYMELLTFNMYDNNLNVQPSSSTSTSTSSYSLMPYLNSPSSSPISSWNCDACNSQNYTSPPHFQPHDTFESFHGQIAMSDITQPSLPTSDLTQPSLPTSNVTQPSLPPFIAPKSPTFNLPPISAPASSFLDVLQHTTEPLGMESVVNAAAATVDFKSSAGGDLITETCNDPQPTAGPLGMESVTAIVTDVVVPQMVGATIVADVAAPQMVTPMIVTDMVVLPAVRKTGCICIEGAEAQREGACLDIPSQ